MKWLPERLPEPRVFFWTSAQNLPQITKTPRGLFIGGASFINRMKRLLGSRVVKNLPGALFTNSLVVFTP